MSDDQFGRAASEESGDGEKQALFKRMMTASKKLLQV